MSSVRFSSAEEVFSAFLPYANLERGQDVGKLRLDRMEALCGLLGHPERAFKSIHVAGSKGKGSICAMLARILEASGLRTGLYCSPHVYSWKERIGLASGPLPEEAYLRAGTELMDSLDSWAADPILASLGKPTFFELLTALAFLAFRDSGCEWAVIETGLGGRLDSTNVILPEASVITDIELEHAEILGRTIPLIAAEKAGIIKAGRPVFLASLRPEAREVMEARASELGCPLESSEDACAVEVGATGLEGTAARVVVKPARGSERGRDLRVKTAMPGGVMARNAALAALVADRLLPRIGDGAIRKGISEARLPARFEAVRKEPLFVLDGAHTPDSVRLLRSTWESLGCGRGESLLLFACAADKDAASMAALLKGAFSRVIVTSPGTFKKSDPLSAFEAFRLASPPDTEVILLPDTAEAVRAALAWKGPVLAAGSFYLAGEVRGLLPRS